MGSVFDGDSGCAQGITNASARAKSFGLAGFGTLLQLFGNQTVKRSMLSGIGTGSGGAAAAPSLTHGSANGSKPSVSSIARTFTKTARTSSFATSESTRSASFESNVLPERIAVKIAAEAPETLISSFIAATKSAGSSSAETETISSRDGCPPTAAPARSMKFDTRSYAD